MKEPTKHGGKSIGFISARTLNEIADRLLDRTPLPGIGTKITEHKNKGFSVDLIAGTSDHREPFKVVVSGSDLIVSSGFVVYTPASGNVEKWPIAGDVNAGYDDPHIKIEGTTTDGVFTPNGTVSLHYANSPGNTDTEKYVKIAAVSDEGALSEELQSDFFFKQKDARFPDPGCEIFVNWQPEFIAFSEEEHPGTQVYTFGGIHNSSPSMVIDESPYVDGFPSRDTFGDPSSSAYTWGTAYLCGALDHAASAAVIQAAFKSRIRDFLDTIESVDIDDWEIHQIVYHGDGSGGLNPATSDTFDEILRELSEMRYRMSVTPYSPEDTTRLEERWS